MLLLPWARPGPPAARRGPGTGRGDRSAEARGPSAAPASSARPASSSPCTKQKPATKQLANKATKQPTTGMAHFPKDLDQRGLGSQGRPTIPASQPSSHTRENQQRGQRMPEGQPNRQERKSGCKPRSRAKGPRPRA